jgi:hypothetical protein
MIIMQLLHELYSFIKNIHRQHPQRIERLIRQQLQVRACLSPSPMPMTVFHGQKEILVRPKVPTAAHRPVLHASSMAGGKRPNSHSN